MSAPSKARPAITPMTIPAIEPPLNLLLWTLDVLGGAEETRPAPFPFPFVGLGAETVIVFTTPPAAVVSLTTLPVVVVVSELVEEVVIVVCPVVLPVELLPPAVLVTCLPGINTYANTPWAALPQLSLG